MATIVYDSITYTVKYVDPFIQSAGDGSTVATALQTLPATLVNYTCYLIRRTTDEDNLGVDLQRTRNSGKTHIMLLGMPYPDSDLYSQIEQDAKTTWGNDPGTYARIRCNTPSANNTAADMAIFYENSIKTLYCETCYFYRDANGSSASDYFWPIFYFDSSNTTDRKLYWKKCKFSYAQYDFESDDFLASNENITLNNYSERKCSNYLYLQDANTVMFKDCIINYAGRYNYRLDYGDQRYGWGRGMLLRYGCKLFIMDGCQVNRLNYESDTNDYPERYPICIESNRQNYTTKAIIRNCELNYIMRIGNTNAYNPCIIWSQAADMTVNNITCNIKHMKNYNTSSYNMNIGNDKPMIFCTDNRNEIKVDGIYMNMANRTDIKISGFPVFYANATPMVQTGNPGSYIKNIDIRFPQSVNRTTSCSIFSVSSSTYCYRGDNDAYECPRFDYGNDHIGMLNWLNNYLITNVYIDAKYHGEWGVRLWRVGMKTDTLNCKVYQYSSTLQVNNLYNYKAESRGYRGDYNAYLKCENYTVNMSRYTGVRQIDQDARSASYITTSNIMPYNENCISTTNQAGATANWVCLNTIESGQFFTRNPMVFAKSWSTVRTGSTSLASLKMYANVYNGIIYPLCIGASPYKGIEIKPATIGKKILTCYCARGLFTTNELQGGITNLWLEVYTPEIQADESIKYYVTDSIGKDFVTDTSTWSGTTAVTPFKIEVPIEVKELTVPVEVKIYYRWYSSAGFVYIDPDIRLVDVVE